MKIIQKTFFVKIFYSFLAILLSGCVYIETLSKEQEFYIETQTKIDSVYVCLFIGGGSYEPIFLSDQYKKYIYKIFLERAEGGKTRGLINKDLIAEEYVRLFFNRCKNNYDFTDVYVKYSFNNLLQLQNYQRDSLIVYKIPNFME